MHWSLLVLKTGGQASTEVGILIHITVSKTVFFIPLTEVFRSHPNCCLYQSPSIDQGILVSSLSSPDDDAEG